MPPYLRHFCVAYMDVGEGREQDEVALKVLMYTYTLRPFALNCRKTGAC